jgi:hypothetical protein
VIDEHSRLYLTILAGMCCKPMDEVVGMEELTGLYPAPAFIVS